MLMYVLSCTPDTTDAGILKLARILMSSNYFACVCLCVFYINPYNDRDGWRVLAENLAF